MRRWDDIMEPVTDLGQYKALIKEKKGQFLRILTNNMQLAGAMTPYIAEGRLFYEDFPQGLAFYLDEGQWYELTYYWDPEGMPGSFRQEKPVIAGEMIRNGSEESAESFLGQNGFRRYRTNLQVERVLNDTDVNAVYAERKAADQGFTWRFCEDDALFEDVLDLWDGYLELGDVPLDHRLRHPEDRILCIFEGEQLAAVNWWRNTRSGSEGRHTVTHRNYQHRGLAYAMLGLWCRYAAEAGARKAFTWINETNLPSLGLYSKAGFKENGRKSIQYILD